jgi:hypothetical protein
MSEDCFHFGDKTMTRIRTQGVHHITFVSSNRQTSSTSPGRARHAAGLRATQPGRTGGKSSVASARGWA